MATTPALTPLYDYARNQGATGLRKLNAGKGCFIALTKLPKGDTNRFGINDKTQVTIPCSKSDAAQNELDLTKFSVLISDGTQGKAGQAIATVNTVTALAEVDL